LAATGNIRVGSNDTISVVGTGGIIVCTESTVDVKAQGNINLISAADFNVGAESANIDADITASGVADMAVQRSVTAQTSGAATPFVASIPNPRNTEAALSAAPARPAEVKPLNDKINIKATWSDPESKFRRDSESVQTTVSRLPTYEPCPEHGNFNFSQVAGYTPILTEDDRTYEGSAGVANTATTPPPTATAEGANNTDLAGDPTSASSVSKDLNLAALRCQLTLHEGLKTSVYLDTRGLPHAGIGHLLRANEASELPVGSPVDTARVEEWFTRDSASAIKIAQDLMGDVWGDLSDIRKRAVVDLSYNLGKTGLSKFRKFLAAMRAKDFATAGVELRNSLWYTQVKKRGENVVTMIVHNIDPTCCDKKFPG